MFARACAALGLLFCVLLVPAHAAADIKVRYFKGAPTFISTLPASAVEIAVPPPSKDHRVWVGVAVLNRASEPQTLGYENVSISSIDGKPAKLHTYDELQHNARVKAGWLTFFAALGAGLNDYAAARSAYGHSYGSAYTSTPFGGVSTTFSGTYYSPVAAQMALDRANGENAAMFYAIANQLDATLAKDDAVLRTTTIDPATSFGGAVVFDLPKGSQLKDLVVTVTFGADVHRIPLDPTSAGLHQASAAEAHLEAAASTTEMAAAPAPVAAPATPEPPAPAAPPAPTKCKTTGLWSPTSSDAVHSTSCS